MTKKKVGFDVDSVLNNLEEAWAKWIVETIDPTFHVQKWTSWGIENHVVPPERVHDFLSMPGSFRNLRPRVGAQEVVKAVSEKSEVFAVSACVSGISMEEKYHWLGEFFPFIPRNNIIFCNRKDLIDVDFLMDDGAHNFLKPDGTPIAACPIVFHHPWNAQIEIAGYRVHGWKEARMVFEQLELL